MTKLRSVLVAALLLVVTACGSSDPEPAAEADADAGSGSTSDAAGEPSGEGGEGGELGVGFVYVSPLRGSGWTQAWDQAREAIEADLGAETTAVEPIPETADSLGVMEDLISQGSELIFATAFGYQPFVLELAEGNPDVAFVAIGPWAQEADIPANVTVVTSDNWITRYALGVLAAGTTESDTLGFVAANPIPTVIASINAFHLGAASVTPDITTRVVFTGTWYDPPRATQAAESLVQAGADVIAQYEDSTGSLLGAERAGAWGIGSEADLSEEAPGAYLSGSVNDWDDFAVGVAQSVSDGSFASENVVATLSSGGVRLGPVNDAVPDDLRAQVEEVLSGLADGSVVPFTGPLASNDGQEVLADGEQWGDSLTVFDNANVLVEGVVGTIPS